jgi:hypothetical protein
MSQPSPPTTTTQIQKTELPAWVDAASQGNYAFAEQVANRPFQQYQGQTVAPLSQGEQAAGGILGAGMSGSSALQSAAAAMMGKAGTYQPGQVQSGGYLSVGAPKGVADVGSFAGAAPVQGGQGYQQIAAPGAVGNVANAAGATPIGPIQGVQDVTAQRFDGAQLGGYLSPYTNNVVDTTLSGMRDNLALSSQKVDDAAMGSGAWGSSRSGVQQAVLASQGAKDMASTEAGLRSAAYTDAAGRLMADNTSALQAALANQQSGLTTQGRQLTADQSNQQSTLTTQALNADIGKANQSAGLQTEAQRLSANTSNASNFLANAGQKLQADQGNQTSTNANNSLNAGIAQGNQSSALQTAKDSLTAALGNQGAFTNAAGQSLDAQKSNQTAGLNAANLGLQAGSALGGLGNDVTNNAGKNALLSAQLGSNDRAVQQAQLDSDAAKWQNEYDAPLTALNTRLAALGMSPYGKTTNTQETKTGGTSSNGALSALGGIMSFLPLMFSDERLKKNVRTEGTTEAGVPLKSYEYKGFMAKEAPGRHMGVMAQDLEKKDPGAVHRVKAKDGKTYRAVDYSRVGRGFMGRAAA